MLGSSWLNWGSPDLQSLSNLKDKDALINQDSEVRHLLFFPFQVLKDTWENLEGAELFFFERKICFKKNQDFKEFFGDISTITHEDVGEVVKGHLEEEEEKEEEAFQRGTGKSVKE